MDIRGTETEKNLLQAFAGESQAHSRYTFFASQAKKDGFVAISRLFSEIAVQEEEHAKCFFAYLQGGAVEITMKMPAVPVASTVKNLRSSIKGEHGEWSEIYTNSAEEARSEGFDEIANRFQSIAFAERQHEMRFQRVLKQLEDGVFFHSDTPRTWRCLNCGYVHEGTDAPAVCPACDHPQAFYERISEER